MQFCAARIGASGRGFEGVRGNALHTVNICNILRMYEVALKLQPNSTLVYFNLGNIYLEKGYMENAQLLLTSMQMYVHVIGLEPLYRGGFNNLGNALKEADFFDHAIRAWNAALRMYANTPLCHKQNVTSCTFFPPTLTCSPTSCTCACICATGPTATAASLR